MLNMKFFRSNICHHLKPFAYEFFLIILIFISFMYFGIPYNTSFINLLLNLCIETNVQMVSEEDSAVPLETTEKDSKVEVEPYDTEAAEKGPYSTQCLISLYRCMI